MEAHRLKEDLLIMADLPFVSVVIPTWNRARLLADCLETLRAQDYPKDRFEIVIGGTHYALAARRMGEPFSLRGALRSFVLSLLHFARRRCTYGLLKAVWVIGFVAGRIRREEPQGRGGRRC